MPPKRKAVDALSARGSKRSTPAPTTPQSIDSDDDYSDDSVDSHDDKPQKGKPKVGRDLSKVMDKFSLESFQKEHGNASYGSKDSFFGKRDFSLMKLKPDHANRPLYIDPNKLIITLESFSPLAAQANDFLITIAEPLSRPKYLHEYRLTINSLYAAVSIGLKPEDIISFLDRLCKTPLPAEVRDFVEQYTKSYGSIKLVLKHNRFFVESTDPSILQMLLKDEVIGPLRIQGTEGITQEAAPQMSGLIIPGTKDAAGARQVTGQQEEESTQKPEDDIMAALREPDDDEEETAQVHSFEINNESVEAVKQRCDAIGYPALEEYDFRNDLINPNLDIDLKPNTQIRSYQEKSLSKMFGNGRAKSGIIVLPCGAGKTLVGITAACTIRKGCIVLCTSTMSAVQWRNEFLKWSNLDPADCSVFTSDHKEKFRGKTGVIVTTYSMVSQSKNRVRSHDSKQMMDWITAREWGLMLLDEVHVVPASMFRKATSSIATHCKLGLTATLLREDDKIKDLNFLIGPKLYEANWMELSEQGHIARVQCAEVWCPMTTEFYSEYLREKSRKAALLYVMNPRKFQACQFLIEHHEKRGDKIIVFSDNVYALEKYALKLNKAYIYGGTPQQERIRILDNFRHNEQVNTVFLSKIGDTSLDLPEATCLIQISSHYGSRRQEAQRLGRILRAKRRNDEGFNAFFYSLVSKDTNEMYFSSKRQAFLVDQGYSFKVITQLQGIENTPNLAYPTVSEQRELLQEVMLQNESSADVEDVIDDLFSKRSGRIKTGGNSGVRRTAATLSGLAGGEDMAYVEYNKSRNKELKGKKKESSKFFKALSKENQRQRDMMKEAGGLK